MQQYSDPQVRAVSTMGSVPENGQPLKLSSLSSQLIELVPQVVWLANQEGDILRLNSVWQRYTGVSTDAACQQDLWQFFHPDDQLRLTTRWQQAILLQQPLQMKGRLRMLDDSYEWFSVVAQPMGTENASDGATWFGLMQRLASATGEPYLMEGQEFLEALFRHAADAVVACNDKGQLVLFNRAAQEFHGLPPEPIDPAEWPQYYDLYDGTGTRRLGPEEVPLLRALNGEAVRDVKMMVMPKGGQGRSLIANADPIYTVTGQKLGAVVVMRDVTAYQDVKMELDFSEQRFQAIFNCSFQMVGLLSVDGILLEANQTALDFRQLQPEDVLHRPFWETAWWDTLNDAELEKLKQSIQRAAAGEFIRYEVDIQDPNQQVMSIDFSLKPVFDQDGKVKLVIPEARDVTARKTAEAELRQLTTELEKRVAQRTAALETAVSQLERKNLELEESEALFRSTFEQVAMGCAHVDVSGSWLRMNQKLCEIVGYTREELLQLTFQDITHVEDLAADLALVQQLLDGEIPSYSLEKRYIRKQGEITWARITVSLRRDNQGKPLYFVAMVEDINERKWLEMRDRVNQQALEQAKLDLEKRNAELDQFVYMASHDLKAPLRGIANLSEWLEEDLSGQLPEENQSQLVLMRQRVKRMEALISGLLQYSRVGRANVTVETVDTHQLLLEVIDSLAPPATFMLCLPQSMPTFRAKRLLLSQVFANLISNAIKHHDRDAGKIVISWHESAQQHHFAVIDDGPGVPVEQQQQIFTLFQTLNNSNDSENTGIGLAIVRKIVEAEGGMIELFPTADRGCRFEFSWPKQAD